MYSIAASVTNKAAAETLKFKLTWTYLCMELQTFKWQEHISWQKKLNEAKASAAALKASLIGMSSERKPPESKWRAFFRKSPLEDVQAVVKNNIYDKGFIQNLSEIIFPLSTRPLFTQKIKLKSG